MPELNPSGSLYVGLMSGTSMDGIDAALVDFGNRTCSVVATLHTPYPDKLKVALHSASRNPSECTIDTIGYLDHWVGECLRDAVKALLDENDIDTAAVRAIGSHGQTLRHQPRAVRPFTMQIGDPNIISSGTGVTTVGDFRRRDIAIGGEGAPLAPAFHQWLFAKDDIECVVLNIGGIANVTIFRPPHASVIGFDTGPGNTLLDGWVRRCCDLPFDDEGRWATGGTVSGALLNDMLADPYISLAPPKSTGFEYFNQDWLTEKIGAKNFEIADQDVQATLAEFTAQSIALAVTHHAPDTKEILVCGGGVHNSDLMNRLGASLTGRKIESTEPSGLHPDWVEAAAFAWLAKQRLDMQTGNLPEVTGADRSAILGAIYE